MLPWTHKRRNDWFNNLQASFLLVCKQKTFVGFYQAKLDCSSTEMISLKLKKKIVVFSCLIMIFVDLVTIIISPSDEEIGWVTCRNILIQTIASLIDILREEFSLLPEKKIDILNMHIAYLLHVWFGMFIHHLQQLGCHWSHLQCPPHPPPMADRLHPWSICNIHYHTQLI